HNVPACAQRPARGAPRIDAAATGHGAPAPARAGGEAASEPRREPLDLRQLAGTEGAEVLFGDRLLVAEGRHTDELALPGHFVSPTLKCQTAGALHPRKAWGHPAGRTSTLAIGGYISPEVVEQRIEEGILLDAPDQDGAEREVQLVAAGDVDHAKGTGSVHRVRRCEQHPAVAEGAAEPEYRLDEIAALSSQFRGRVSLRCTARTRHCSTCDICSSRPASSSRSTLRRSASSFRIQPSVSRTVSASRWDAWSVASARAQSRVSATPGTLVSGSFRSVWRRPVICAASSSLRPSTLERTMRSSLSKEG